MSLFQYRLRRGGQFGRWRTRPFSNWIGSECSTATIANRSATWSMFDSRNPIERRKFSLKVLDFFVRSGISSIGAQIGGNKINRSGFGWDWFYYVVIFDFFVTTTRPLIYMLEILGADTTAALLESPAGGLYFVKLATRFRDHFLLVFFRRNGKFWISTYRYMYVYSRLVSQWHS